MQISYSAYFYNILNLFRSWCLTCRAMVKPTCLEAQHQIHDLMEEVAECQTELDVVLKGFKKETQ